MEVLIVTSDHPLEAETGHWQRATTPRPVTIGDRVWIGARAIICPGATIDSDVVVAAGAVVAGHLEAGGIYGGVPAKRLGNRVVGVPAA
jgi:maltose O-acetyltransferase